MNTSSPVKHRSRFSLISLAAAFCATSFLLAAPALADEDEDEKFAIAAVEALVAAPPSRALPLAIKALQSDFSDEVKSRALFVLSQIDHADAQALILDTVRTGEGELRQEAIRMIGISGNKENLMLLRDIYSSADEDTREAVIEAYVIADDKQSVYELAVNAKGEREFEAAVEALGVMNASDELRQLLETRGVSGSLIDAYAISGDADALRQLAQDDSDPEQQANAIEALGIVGGEDVDAMLFEIYKTAGNNRVKSAALDGMLISGHDAGILQLYRESQSSAEKRELLEYLVVMESDDVWNIIDDALGGEE